MNIEHQQKQALGIIWRAFNWNKSAIARAAGVERSAVNNWFSRGRISATAAIVLSERPELQGIITKEEMRPDVKEWYGV